MYIQFYIIQKIEFTQLNKSFSEIYKSNNETVVRMY
jgi:hypothetical protein